MNQQETETLKLAAKAMGFHVESIEANHVWLFNRYPDPEELYGLRKWTPHLGGADAYEILCKFTADIRWFHVIANGFPDLMCRVNLFDDNGNESGDAREYLSCHPFKEIALGWALVKAAASTVKD